MGIFNMSHKYKHPSRRLRCKQIRTKGLDRWQRSPTGNLYVRYRYAHLVAIVCAYLDSSLKAHRYVVKNLQTKQEHWGQSTSIKHAMQYANTILIKGI